MALLLDELNREGGRGHGATERIEDDTLAEYIAAEDLEGDQGSWSPRERWLANLALDLRDERQAHALTELCRKVALGNAQNAIPLCEEARKERDEAIATHLTFFEKCAADFRKAHAELTEARADLKVAVEALERLSGFGNGTELAPAIAADALKQIRKLTDVKD